jgi:hypothetical protein
MEQISVRVKQFTDVSRTPMPDTQGVVTKIYMYSLSFRDTVLSY